MNATQARAIASARVASCPDGRSLERMSRGRRLSVLELQVEAWETLGLSAPSELLESVQANQPAVNSARERMAAGHRRVFPSGCNSGACSYGC